MSAQEIFTFNMIGNKCGVLTSLYLHQLI